MTKLNNRLGAGLETRCAMSALLPSIEVLWHITLDTSSQDGSQAFIRLREYKG